VEGSFLGGMVENFVRRAQKTSSNREKEGKKSEEGRVRNPTCWRNQQKREEKEEKLEGIEGKLFQKKIASLISFSGQR